MAVSLTVQAMPFYKRDEVVVTASRMPTNFDETNRNVVVLSRYDIENSGATSMQELLGYAAGVDVRTRGINGVQSDINIRGCAFDQSLVLIDGVKVSDPQTGHHNMNIPLNVSDIDRIEVLKGHGSRLYGPNALGGTINIITRRSAEKSITMNLSGGEFGLFEGSVSLSQPFRNSSHQVSFARSRSDGYMDASEHDINSAYYGSTLRIGAGELDFTLGYQDKEFGASTFYSDLFPDEWEHTTSIFTNISGSILHGSNIYRVSLFQRNHRDDFVLDNAHPDWYRNKHTTDLYGGDVQATFSSRFGDLSVGGEVSQEVIESKSLGNHNRNRFGMFAEHKFALYRRIDMTWGATAYNYSD